MIDPLICIQIQISITTANFRSSLLRVDFDCLNDDPHRRKSSDICSYPATPAASPFSILPSPFTPLLISWILFSIRSYCFWYYSFQEHCIKISCGNGYLKQREKGLEKFTLRFLLTIKNGEITLIIQLVCGLSTFAWARFTFPLSYVHFLFGLLLDQ